MQNFMAIRIAQNGLILLSIFLGIMSIVGFTENIYKLIERRNEDLLLKANIDFRSRSYTSKFNRIKELEEVIEDEFLIYYRKNRDEDNLDA